MESFIQEMKRYLGFSAQDVALLRQMGSRLEKHFGEMSERFYSQIPHHPQAYRVFTGGETQIARLKHTLQLWARGLFEGHYDEDYANDRYQIGYRHVRIGLEQKYVISAMGIVRAFFNECLIAEYPASDERLQASRTLNRMLDLDLNLMCESYMHASMENLRVLNLRLAEANTGLAEASKAKDDFLAHISHELRTPLNSILGFTKLILDGKCATPEEEHDLLRDVFSSAQHLLGIVNDILDIGRIEAGKVALHLEQIDPRALLDSTLPLLQVQVAEKGLEVRDLTFDLRLPFVRADEVRLRQVVLNVLENAIKFTAHGSITLRAVVRDHFLRFEIEDTGIGIPFAKREVVFQKFMQADALQARRLGGSGLGLTISRKLIEMMGGQIGLTDSSSGQGTLAWFTIPLASTAAQSQI